MYLFLSIILATILGYILLMMGPLVGGLIAFGIVVGCLFRGMYLLSDIHKKLDMIIPKQDRVDQAIAHYMKEKDAN